MNVLWVFAHPEPRSLGGALRDDGLATLRSLGHTVAESDLYAMDACLSVADRSARAFADGELSPRRPPARPAWPSTFAAFEHLPPELMKGTFLP